MDLKLDKITGLRADKIARQPIKLKEDNKLPKEQRSIKTKSNLKKGKKY